MEHLAGSREIEKAFAFLHAKGLRNAVIHAGSDGAFVSDGANIEVVEPQLSGPVVDVTGAGDAAVSGLLYGLLQGEYLVTAAVRGQILAGRVIASPRSTLE
jgi:pseudouridine kinase